MNTAVHLLDRMLVVTVCCAAFGAGCSAEKFKTAEVRGTVTLEGTPVEGVSVEFEPVRTGAEIPPTAYGSTDAEGKYRLTRVGGKGGRPGAVVGMNIVRVSAPEGSSAKVHPHYADEGAFQYEVKAGPNIFDIDLMKNPLATGRKAGRE
ncbi:MAG: hypothetical protein O3A37_11105 [Planctomycetota bacterium]|nr:hypothetical protein [Planctomycetota bacterium]